MASAASPPIREPIIDKRTGRLSPVWERYFTVTLNPSANQLLEQINKLLEQINTNFKDGSIPFAKDGFLTEDNNHLTWDVENLLLKVLGIVQSRGRRMGTKTIDFSMSPYQIELTDEIIWVDATDGPTELLLLSAVNIDGQTYSIEKIDETSNIVKTTTSGSETINGDSSFDLLYQYESIKPTSTGSGWLI